jgi:P-type Ca2+ transporter type 2C
MKPLYNQDINELIALFKTNLHVGLTPEAAKQRLKEYGYNKLKSKAKKSLFQMFLIQFKSFMIFILLIAAAISGVIGVLEGEGLLDTYIILGILVLNALVGVYQEHKAEVSLEALKSLSAPETKVLRDGILAMIPTRELVPGDLVTLETGDVVPADLRLVEAVNLKIQESALTGESVAAAKQSGALKDTDIPLGDRMNMAFSGGIVTYGRGRGIVVATGMQTEVGKIADMLQQTVDTETPMSIRLKKLGKILGIAALIICAVIFLVGVLYGNSVADMFMTAVSLAVAAIPEGLPAVSTVVLAVGVQRMVKRNAIIRTLPSVETLGSATIICSDKTGTLTQNRMTVVELFVNLRSEKIHKENTEKPIPEEIGKLLSVAVLCTDARISTQENGKTELIGDPTETALLDVGILYGIKKQKLEEEYPRVGEIPFDSGRKRMATINRLNDNRVRVHVKGGMEEVLERCTKIAVNGSIRVLTSADKQQIRAANESMANSALRILAMAFTDLSEIPEPVEVETLERDLVFAGLCGMMDPPRPEAMEAVAKCNSAGIHPVMITGDHKNTAIAIARKTGIFREGDQAITGTELEKLTEEEFQNNVTRYSVYARVAPEHKVRIVQAWQKKKEIVAMTGDGVNDAPALKQADIGAAMGSTGTDVAKGAADMILTDDNFATIVAAVEEGRRIYDNILKAIQFLLSTNIGEIFLLLVTAVFNLGTPLLPIHILWVNLVTDSLPALALSVDPAEADIMKRKPRRTNKGFMTRGMIWRMMYQGIMLGAIPLVAYITGLRNGGETMGQTMAFASLIFAQLVHVRNVHSVHRSSWRTHPLKNIPLMVAVFVSSGLALLVLLIAPVRETFHFSPLERNNWLIIGLLSLIPLLVVEIFKLLKINGTKDEISSHS